MATVILLRHARSTANGSAVLAGRQPGVALDDTGVGQAARLPDRLSALPLAALVTSPLERCQQTLRPLAEARGMTPVVEPELAEVDYGDWTGRALKDLVEEPLWRVVQQHPSAAVFPGGEGLASVQARAVAALRAHDARITAEHGQDSVWVACSHGDVIKAVLADALGAHLDAFQRIVVDPCSVSVIRYTETRPFVLRINDNGGDLAGVVPPKPSPEQAGAEAARADGSDAVIGGSTGTP
ncbi:putative phosphomutase, MSMEG_4193 family [Streptoalloteichus tenebrarius]|uniref:Phosphomutase, MSMEG_4193 family n=1 Tax=Streptoalloteichus tenebrarius (strain ATCC 17920 / DSM 40477 / JCM 4838 / CBS 697.72 / NBRC 16177 / NCIMB 11028 / NRRL B-12390 / A12253. 1 / ISP 5477) TaxID=1933 RepID=A0ABT1HPP5_STRSD|nr:histidine phosphatase family protein [Streptoalloteichus tenebrarius]MCP2257487.1 putative phosphomutase, MSMEG_4193 family [Streptoalloteichus tenebrarius]BFE98436.1 histidine phosphatase family protein [Streptoalloteichus tenebrarius]